VFRVLLVSSAPPNSRRPTGLQASHFR